jgi:hypothetical protein
VAGGFFDSTLCVWVANAFEDPLVGEMARPAIGVEVGAVVLLTRHNTVPEYFCENVVYVGEGELRVNLLLALAV